jgi:MarR family transcriptional repressor of emrRAB
MSGIEQLASVARSTPLLAKALPGLPMEGTLLVRLIRLASAATTGYFEPYFRSSDISENQFHVLCLLESSVDGKASPSGLSELVGTGRANMTRVLEALTRDGWVERTKASRDGRRQVVCITQAGREKVQATVPQIAEPILKAFARLDRVEIAQLQNLLSKLVISLDPGSDFRTEPAQNAQIEAQRRDEWISDLV